MPASALLVLPPGLRPARHEGRQDLVPNGENQYHAIFGGGPAYFVSPSSLGPALVALGAKVKLVSASGKRDIDAAKFFVAPKADTVARSLCKPNEILTEILIPAGAGIKTRRTRYASRRRSTGRWPRHRSR